jgi:hypothetical protein
MQLELMLDPWQRQIRNSVVTPWRRISSGQWDPKLEFVSPLEGLPSFEFSHQFESESGDATSS